MLPSSTSSSSGAHERLWIIGLSIALAVYSLVVGVALLAGALSPFHASWLLALVPFVLACWYVYGFLQPNPSSKGTSAPDFGLLLSAGGWALTLLSLLIAQPAPIPSNATSSSSDVTAAFCGVLALLCLLCGAILSWRSWNETASHNAI